jgi:predicted nucleic acid-binding protein
MTTAIDTNVLVALWAGTPAVATMVQQTLSRASERGPLLVAAPVHAELIAAPQWTANVVDQLLGTMQVSVDWNIDEAMWRIAGLAYRGYAERLGAILLTSDQRLYRSAFSNLRLEILEESAPSPED